MPPKHLVSSSDIDKVGYEEIVRRGLKFISKGIPPDLCKGKIVATLFFQPSTRTMSSFQSAMCRAGGDWIGVMGEKGLSMEKGETLEDTIAEYGNFADCIALRHGDDDSADRAASVSRVPVMNCGSGSREHAVGTPMLLTMLAHFIKKPLKDLRIGLYGTPEINRATKAFVPILGMFETSLVIDDLGHFPLPKEVEDAAKKNGMRSLTYDKLDNFIGDVDALFVTRGLQKGIIPPDKFPKEKEEMIIKSFKPISKEHMKKMRKDAILYMIKPRIFEILPEVDDDPRATYSKPEPYVESVLALMTYLLGIKV